MTHVGAAVPAGRAAQGAPVWMFAIIAWRNLWRNRRRTWLTAGGIAFAVLLVVFSMSMQGGSYDAMVDNASRLATGHIQIQHPDYHDDPKLRSTMLDATARMRTAAEVEGVTAVAPRVEGFALVSAGERSYGAMVVGVDPAVERHVSSLPGMLDEGRYLEAADDAYLGAALARNLGVEVGDELVVLGTAKEGGIAAMAFNVAGTFDSGQTELDRTILQVRLPALQNGFELGDELHRIVVMTGDVGTANRVAARLRRVLGDGVAVLNWNDLMPEIEQAIQLDKISANFMYWIIMILVTLSIVNTFIMTVFERTREFGMLISLGMRPHSIILMLQFEALCMWLVGAGLGFALCLAVVLPLGQIGIPLAGMEDLARQYSMPDRLYPLLDLRSVVTAPLVMGIGTLLAGLIPSWRVTKLEPIEALRAAE